MLPGSDSVTNFLRQSLRPETPVRDLDLSVRASGGISKVGVRTVHDLALLNPKKLLNLTSIGKNSIKEIAAVLDSFFLSLTRPQLAKYSETIPLWRPYFSQPEPLQIGTQLDQPKSYPEEVQFGIEQLKLSTRAIDCLKRAGITDLHELALCLPRDIRHVSFHGNKLLVELAHYLKLYFDFVGPKSSILYAKTYDAWERYIRAPFASDVNELHSAKAVRECPLPLSEVVKGFLAEQGQKKREMFVRRFGLTPGSRAHTLAAVGRDFGLTRERIRQIASKEQIRFTKFVRLCRPDIVDYLGEYFENAKVAKLSEIAQSVPNVGDRESFALEACIRLLLEGLSPQVHPVDPSGQLWTSCESITAEFYPEVIRTAKAALHGIPAKLEELAFQTARQLACTDQAEIETIKRIIRNCPALFTVAATDQTEVVSPIHQNLSGRRRGFAYEYIKEQGIPIHISEILDAMQQVEPELIPELTTSRSAMHAMRSLFERDTRFAWAGLSTFGLREWGYESGVSSIGGAAIHLLRTAGRPLTISEIRKALGHLYQVSPYSITAALNTEKGKTVGKDPEGRWFALR